jgi:hypothetical protein
MPRTVLHIGAHKTATTYMQQKLAINIEALATRGIHYDPLDILRKNFTSALQNNPRANWEFVENLRGRTKQQDVLISEENISGVPGDLVRHGVYYANISDRLKTIINMLDIDTPEIYIGLREYSSFMVSMYSEYIRHREFIRFVDYFELYDKSGFSWVKVISDIIDAVPRAKVHIWDFSKFRDIETQVFAGLLGQDPGFLQNPEGPVRESFSEKAMQVFEVLSGMLTHREMKHLITPVARALPRSGEYKAFEPMEPATAAVLKQQYLQDLASISAKFPKVEFIGGRPQA